MAAAYVRITNDESASKPSFAIITRLDWSYATIAFHCLGCVQLSTANISSYLTSCESNWLFSLRIEVYFIAICKDSGIFPQNLKNGIIMKLLIALSCL
jgi:hypothetical protein